MYSIRMYSTPEVCKVLNLERERLRDWLAKGFIKETTPARKQGSKAFYSLYALYRVYLFKMFIDNGMSRKVASNIIGAYMTDRTLNERINQEFMYLKKGKPVRWVDNPDIDIDLNLRKKLDAIDELIEKIL